MSDFLYPVGTSRGSGRLPAAGKKLLRTYRVRDFQYPVGTIREKAACRRQARSICVTNKTKVWYIEMRERCVLKSVFALAATLNGIDLIRGIIVDGRSNKGNRH